ncbi:MAG: hypothetical protein Q4F00_07380 [bacterium]|nr:hypothetical protein [bacterium]
MPEFDEQEFHRAYYLLAVYAHELIRRQEYMPEDTWRSQIKDEEFPNTVADLVERGLVLEVAPEGGKKGYAITEAGQALVWLYSDVIREIWKKNMNGEGDQLIDFLVANLDAYADEQRKLAAAQPTEETAAPAAE